MKIKHLLIGMLAIAGAVACKQEEPVVEPKLDVAPAAVSVAATAGEATFDVTSNQSWVATADADWVSLEPASGEASDKAVTVKVTAEDNTAAEARKVTVTVKAGELTKTVEVAQAAAQADEPGGEPADVDIDAKQWTFVSESLYGVTCVLDLGVTMPGVALFAYDMGYLDPSYEGVWTAMLAVEYAVTKTDGTSGYITLTAGEETLDVPYSNATETTVHLELMELFEENVDCTLAATKIEITMELETESALDGKQWLFQNDEMPVLVDLGLYEEGVMVVAVPLMDGSGFGAYMYGPYEVVPADETSGIIVFTQYDPEWDEFMDPVEYPYSELSENVVYISAESLVGDSTPLPFVAVEEPYEILFDEIGGGADPVGPIENGQYWFFNGTKVMAPLAEGETTGVLPTGNVIDGASTEKNIFTLMYDPDWSYYTIMDSYGRFLGQTDETGNITVTDVLPTDDTYAFYLWCVEPGYGEATSIYNSAYYYDITYSATDNNWVLVDGGYEYPEILPTLVKAENPVEEPTGPQAITVAEFLAFSVGTTEYELTGVIEGTYNTTYGNFYLNDGTGKVLVYGLTKTKVSSNDKSFASLGLRDGDTLTLIGQRADYNGTAQVGGPAYYVSHIAAPYVDFEASATVNAEETSYSIAVESNTSWTASASEGVTLDKTSGNGNATVVMSFAANTASEAVAHTVTFAVEGSTKTFTLTQKAVPAAGEVVVFEESFSKSTGTMGWDGTNGNGTFATDNTGWTVENAYGAGGSAKFGTSSKAGKATTPALAITGSATLTFKAGAWNNSAESTTLKLSMTGGTLSVSSVTLKKGDWTEYEVIITDATEGAKITFEANTASKNRFFLDDVKIVQAQ